MVSPACEQRESPGQRLAVAQEKGAEERPRPQHQDAAKAETRCTSEQEAKMRNQQQRRMQTCDHFIEKYEENELSFFHSGEQLL